MSPDDDFKLSPELELQRIITLAGGGEDLQPVGKLLETTPPRQDH